MMTPRIEGSFSSSNLSPLAPPFKVDKTLTKPNSINPSSNFIEGPCYGSCFDPFAYDLFPNNMSSNTNEPEKSNFGPYIPSPRKKDGFLNLGFGNESGYDLFSNSKWGPSWNGFTLKELGVSHLPTNKGPIFVDDSNESQSQTFVDINVHPFGDGINGDCRFDDMSNVSHLKRGASSTLDFGLNRPTSTSKDSCFDIFGGAFSLDCLGNKPLFESSNKKTSPNSSTESPYGGPVSLVETTPSVLKWNSFFDPTVKIGESVPSIVACDCQIREIDKTRVNDKVSYEKMGFSPQLNHQISLHGLNMENSDVNVEALYSVEKNISGSDIHNPVEDSPCWKRASSHQFLPFIKSESADFDDLVKQFDRCSLSSQNYDRVLNNNEDCSSSHSKSHCFNSYESTVECDIMKKSNVDLCDLSSITENNDPNLALGKKASLKSKGEDSESKIDVDVLLRTMMNLSERLHCYCLGNRAEVSEKCSLAVKQILRNLKASMFLISGHSILTTLLSSSHKRGLKESPVVEMVNDGVLASSLKLGGMTEDIFGISCKHVDNSLEDANMTEAVTKLISKGFEDEKMDDQKLLYKNLWLEAEASLCVLTAKTRLLCMKTEMKKNHDGTKGENNTTSLNVGPNLHKDNELANNGIHSLSHNDYVKVPKSQASHIEFLKADVSTTTKKKTSFSSLWAPRPSALGNNQDSCSTSHVNEVETRVSCPGTLNYERKQTSGVDECSSCTKSEGKDTETFVFGGYQTLKGLDDNQGCYNYEGQKLPGDDNYLPNDNCSTVDNALQESLMSNSSLTDEHKASVVSRFRLIKNRMDRSNSLINNLAPKKVNTKVVDDKIEDVSKCQKKGNIKKNSFGQYSELFEDENVNSFDIGVIEEAFDAPILKMNKMSNLILEDWYENDPFSLDWEHISSRDVV